MAGERTTYTDGRTKRERYLQLKAALWSERSSFDAHWRELSRFVRPRRERFFVGDKNKGDRRNQDIIDSTATFSLRTLQSGLQAGLTSPARPWFRLTTPDPSMAERGPVKAWLHQVTSRMQIVLLRSNVYNHLPILYGDLGLFGTGALAIFADEDELLRAQTYPIGSYAVAIDARGRPSTFIREYQLTVDQLIGEFGGVDGKPLSPGEAIDRSRFSAAVLTAWDQGHTQTAITICWVVTANRDYRADALDGRQFPYSSCYFESGESGKDQRGGFLREAGFRQFPVMVPRWDVTAEDTYGTDCPAMTVLGDIKQLQKEQKRKGQALEKMLNPPTVAPTHLRTQKVSLIPGDITYADLREGGQGIKPIHEVDYPLGDVTLDIREVQFRIKTAFYEPLFLMLAQSDPSRGAQPMTATEVNERHEEKLIQLGPVLERTNDELLDPLIDRVYALMEEAGLIPPPPPELEGVDLGVEYLSVMAGAQKLVGVGGQDRFLQSVGAIAQIWPAARHKVDPFQVVDNYADMLGVDPEIVRDDEQAEQLQQAESQAIQQAQQAQEQALHAKSARDLAGASLEGDSALRRVVEGVTG